MRVIDREKLEGLEAYIEAFAYHTNGEMPSLAEIAEHTGLSKATAYRYLLRLREEGRIEYSGKGTLELAEKKSGTRKYRSVRVPIYGSVICGSPEEEEQHSDGYLAIPEEWIDGECFLLRAYGDSMTDAGVDEGDLVLVKRTGHAEEGQIVVALTGEGNTLKRLGRENGRTVLLAENASYPESRRVLRPDVISVQGIALKIIKDVR